MDAKVNSIPRRRLAQQLIVEWTHKHTETLQTHTHTHFWLLLSKLKLLDNYCLLYLSRGKGTWHRRGLRTIRSSSNTLSYSHIQVCVSWSCGRFVIISAYLLFKSFRLIECQTLEKVSLDPRYSILHTPYSTQRLSSFFTRLFSNW